MASFDPQEKDQIADKISLEVTKYPIKRLELSIKKFVKVLDIDLNRLFKHTSNISKLTNAEDWNGLHREQVNASRTIQQIKANIKEIEKTRNQVKDEDLEEFDARVQEVKSKAVYAMDEFMRFIGMESSTAPQISDTALSNELSLDSRRESPPQGIKSCSHHVQESSFYQDSENHSGIIYDSGGAQPETPYGSLPATLTMSAPLIGTSLHVVPQSSEASASWEQLQESIVELNELVHEFATKVEEQGEVISNIEDNIDAAHENVRQGTQQLAKAAKYKSVLFPVVGAVVGGAVAGPIGLVAGIKIGGLAGAVGGAVGFAGGRFVRKRQDKISDTEMKNLSDKRSFSLSDLPDNVAADKKEPAEVRTENQQVFVDETQEEKVEDEEADVFSSVATSFKRFFSFAEEK